MRYVVHGAGAVGGVIGARLHLAGRAVTLVARGAHLEAIRSGGLVLDAADGRHRIDAPATDTAADVTVVCATNGIATETAALRLFARTYAVCVMLPATHLEPGVVVAGCHPTPAILDIGRIPGGTDATTAAVVRDLHAAGIASEERADIMAWKRRKLLMNLGNGVDASFAPGESADELADLALAEGERVLAAAGVTLVTAEEDTARRGTILQRRTDLERRGGSTWQSLSRGTGDSEIDYLGGEIVLQGRLLGIPTPANEAIVAATWGLAHAGAPPRSLDAAEVLATI